MTGDLVSDNLTSVILKRGYVVDARVIWTDDPFLRSITSVHSPSTAGFGFFSVAAVGVTAGTDVFFGGHGGFSLALKGSF